MYLFFSFKKELKDFIALGSFLSSLPAIDVKKLLKWIAVIKSSEVVLLSIFKVIWWDPVFEVFVLIGVFIPNHILLESVLLVSKYVVVFFAKTTQSYFLIFVVFKFLMKNIPTGRVGSLAKLYVQLIFYIDGFKNTSLQTRFWGILFDLSFRDWKWTIFII